MPRSPRLLLVDDELDRLEPLIALLEDAGYVVETAEDGRSALGRLAEDPLPDAVLLDIAMPRMSGYEVRARQLEDERLCGIPVIVLSGSMEPFPRRLRLSTRLAKPVDPRALLETLASIVAA